MERIKFICDSSGDIGPEVAKKMDIHIVPMGIVVEGKYCQDGVDFTAEEFWDKLKTCKEVPTSAGINPQQWYDQLEPFVKSKQYDRLVVTGVGTTMSTTIQCAIEARNMLEEDYPEEMKTLKIDVYNSNMSTIGFGVGFVKAAQMYKDGETYDKIKTFLLDWIDNVEVLYVAFSLDLPKKSGRINSSAAYVGGLLNIRPIMLVKEGKFALLTKVRGDNKVPAKLVEIAKERMREGSDFFCMNGTHPTVVDSVTKAFETEFGRKMFSTSLAGPAMTLNGGWDMFCIGFVGKKPIPMENPL